MLADRTHRPLHFLTLGLAGVCLTLAELPFLPWMPYALVLYLLLVMAAHHYAGQFILSETITNLFGLGIGIAAGVWIYLRAGADDWAAEVTLPSALVPYLGPVLMALTCVRIFRPRSPSDFWLLQALGLVQVALGCVLANGTLFGAALVAYLAAALCALAAHERHQWSLRSALVLRPDPVPARSPVFFSALRWGIGTAFAALVLFLLSPRTDQPEWDPLTRFGVRSGPTTASKTGFSEEINLNRGGRIHSDDTPAFWFDLSDRSGRPRDGMPVNQRFRGAVLDRHEDGVWRSELTWPTGPPPRRHRQPLDPGGDSLLFHFRVPRRAGGLFLANPVRLTTSPGEIPVVPEAGTSGRLFFEAGDTAVASQGQGIHEVRYIQAVDPAASLERWPLRRLRDGYLLRLMRGVPDGMEDVARQILLPHLGTDPALRTCLLRTPIDLPPLVWERTARLLEGHLARSGLFSYSMVSGPTQPDSDPTLDFLRRVRQGPCERYASSLTLLLRAAGIPARIVKGYRAAEPQGFGHFVVRQSAAHAWVEAVVATPDQGDAYEWIMLDGTPDAEAGGPSALIQWWQRQQREGQEFWRDLIVGYNARSQAQVMERIASWQYWEGWGPILVLVAATFGAGLGLRWLGRRERKRGRGTASLWDRMQVLLRRRGLVAEPGETPAELAARAGIALPSLGSTASDVVALRYREQFGAVPASADELNSLAERIAVLEKNP